MPNRLAREPSPYLLQHADNPVDWYPWSEEAFAKARAEDKPVFLSIGYSTCHWCHVMAHESFEDEEVAETLNRDFVSIKVDREERPDVDDVYMQAVQMMTGSGGWPLSLFLTPQGRPFFGGTYFPPAPRFGRPGFPQVLSGIARAWREKRDELESSAHEMLEHLSAEAQGVEGTGSPGPEILEMEVIGLAQQFDRRDGGFGSAPKFPPSMRLEVLIRRLGRTGGETVPEMIETTLDRMASGGIYDHVGGGFHRYSVDAQWLVPHFEKMLYDNAMLARVYLLAARALGKADYRRVVRETLDYLLAEMTPEGGGFFAAQDADSAGEEGTFYVWNPGSLEEAVGKDVAPIVAARSGVTMRGNFEHGETVLSIVRSVPELASEFGKSEEEIEGVLAESRRRMYEARSRRIPPGTDDKLLTDWTSLAISAFALAGRLLEEPRYEKAAREAADRILDRCVREGELLHREKAGRADIPGFATDYAFFVEALLDLYEATFVPRYFREAVRLEKAFHERFTDSRGGYYLAQSRHDGLIVRPAEGWDAATPSANSIAAMNLARLAAFTGREEYRERADAMFSRYRAYLERAPAAFPRMLCALDFATDRSCEVVLAGEPGRGDFEAMRRAVFESRRLNRVLAHAGGESAPELSSLLDGRASRDGKATAYVCEAFACRAPMDDPGKLRAALDER